MKVAVIIVNYNDVDDTEKYVKTITKYECLNRIVVVDNQSTTQGTFETLKKLESSKVKVIQSEKNGGYNYGNNYVKAIVHDAKIVKYHPDQIRTIQRATYRFSVKLGRSNVGFLGQMVPEHLTEKDFVTLLNFFENL